VAGVGPMPAEAEGEAAGEGERREGVAEALPPAREALRLAAPLPVAAPAAVPLGAGARVGSGGEGEATGEAEAREGEGSALARGEAVTLLVDVGERVRYSDREGVLDAAGAAEGDAPRVALPPPPPALAVAPRALRLAPAEAAPEPDAEPTALAVLLAERLIDAVAAPVAAPVGAGEPLREGGAEATWERDSGCEGVAGRLGSALRLPLAQPLAERVGARALAVPLPAAGEAVAAAEALPRPPALLPVGAGAVGVGEGAPEGEAQPLPAAVGEPAAEPRADALSLRLRGGDAEAEAEGAPEREAGASAEAEAEAVEEGDSEGEGEGAREPEGDGDAREEAEGEGEPRGEAEAEGERGGEGEPRGEGEPLRLPSALREGAAGVAVGESAAVADTATVGAAEPLRVALVRAEALPARLAAPLAEAEALALGLADAEPLREGERVGAPEALPVGAPGEGEAPPEAAPRALRLGSGERLPPARLAEAAAEGSGERLGAREADTLRLGAGERLSLGLAEGEPLRRALPLPLRVAGGDAGGDPDAVDELEREALADTVAGRVGRGAAEREGEPLAQPLRAPLAVPPDAVGARVVLREPGGEGEAPRDARKEAEPAALALAAPVGASERDAAGVLERVAVARGEPLPALRLGETEGGSDASGEAEARLGEGRPETETPLGLREWAGVTVRVRVTAGLRVAAVEGATPPAARSRARAPCAALRRWCARGNWAGVAPPQDKRSRRGRNAAHIATDDAARWINAPPPPSVVPPLAHTAAAATAANPRFLKCTADFNIMCLRIKRFSGCLTLLAVLLAWLLALRESCPPAAGSPAALEVASRPPPPATRAAARHPFNATASTAPTSAPAVLECAIPIDVLAPTQRPSPSAYPSLRPPPSGALDAAVAAARGAALRRHSAQCGATFSDLLGNASARLQFCDDYPLAVLGGARAERDGPFFTPRCPSVWFSPGEACDLLAGLNRLILFVGDSIARQLNQGFVNVLTGSYTHGGVPKFSFPEAEICRCDDAFKYDCRERTYANYNGPGDLICPKWVGRNYVAQQMRLHSVDYFKEHFVEVEGTMTIGGANYGGSVIVLNLGLHENLDAAYLMAEVYASYARSPAESQRARTAALHAHPNVHPLNHRPPNPNPTGAHDRHREAAGRRARDLRGAAHAGRVAEAGSVPHRPGRERGDQLQRAAAEVLQGPRRGGA
jgi:hypothetical protein